MPAAANGSDTLWLAARGWQVTAIDFAATALAHARSTAEAMGSDVEGTLFMVGHRPIDPTTGAPTAAAGQVQVSVEEARVALNPGNWELVVAEDRPRTQAGTGVDAVIRAQRRR